MELEEPEGQGKELQGRACRGLKGRTRWQRLRAGCVLEAGTEAPEGH